MHAWYTPGFLHEAVFNHILTISYVYTIYLILLTCNLCLALLRDISNITPLIYPDFFFNFNSLNSSGVACWNTGWFCSCAGNHSCSEVTFEMPYHFQKTVPYSTPPHPLSPTFSLLPLLSLSLNLGSGGDILYMCQLGLRTPYSLTCIILTS